MNSDWSISGGNRSHLLRKGVCSLKKTLMRIERPKGCGQCRLVVWICQWRYECTCSHSVDVWRTYGSTLPWQQDPILKAGRLANWHKTCNYQLKHPKYYYHMLLSSLFRDSVHNLQDWSTCEPLLSDNHAFRPPNGCQLHCADWLTTYS
jgi:hypothetical protein